MRLGNGGPVVRRLTNHPELLDGPLVDASVLEGNLRDLRRINHALGGTSLSVRAVLSLLRRSTGDATVLDVGTGAADIPLALGSATRRAGRAVSIVAADSRPEVLAAARTIEPRLADDAGLTLFVADARRLPWPDATFDVVHSSLVLHHLEPPEALAFLREAARVSRIGIVINDLSRSRLWWLFALGGTRLLTRNRLTRHDAPLSVLRAYTLPEVRDMVAAAGLRPVHSDFGPFGHRFALAAVREP